MIERIKEDRVLQGMLVVVVILILLLIGKGGGGGEDKEKGKKKEPTAATAVEKNKVSDTVVSPPMPENLPENTQPSFPEGGPPEQVQSPIALTSPSPQEEEKEEKVVEEKKVEEKVVEKKAVPKNGNGNSNSKRKDSVKKGNVNKGNSNKKEETKQEGDEKKARKANTKEKDGTEERVSFKGYGLVCSIGSGCALLDPKSGTDYREGDTFNGWIIKSISPKGIVLEKDGKVIREDFE